MTEIMKTNGAQEHAKNHLIARTLLSNTGLPYNVQLPLWAPSRFDGVSFCFS